MSFQAIVHAPSLRSGVRLNIADLDQTLAHDPKRLALGDEIQIRFGVCCPDLAHAIVIDYAALPESAVLAVGGDQVTICHPVGQGGVAQPGLKSENWYVA